MKNKILIKLCTVFLVAMLAGCATTDPLMQSKCDNSGEIKRINKGQK